LKNKREWTLWKIKNCQTEKPFIHFGVDGFCSYNESVALGKPMISAYLRAQGDFQSFPYKVGAEGLHSFCRSRKMRTFWQNRRGGFV